MGERMQRVLYRAPSSLSYSNARAAIRRLTFRIGSEIFWIGCSYAQTIEL